MRLIKIITLLLSLFITHLSIAYIPPTRMILQRTSEKNGQGAFSIENEIVFTTHNEPFILKEIWTIESDRLMMVKVSSPSESANKVNLEFIYRNNQKNYLVKNGLESKAYSADFIEPLLHARSLDTLANWMVQNKIAPSSILQRKIPPKSLTETKYTPEELVRLSRSGGVINYAFGDGQASSAGLWIEQDMFIIRKIKTVNAAVIENESFQSFNQSLEIAKERNYSWENNTINSKLIKVTPLKISGLNSLQQQKLNITNFIQIDNADLKKQVEDFYSRFR